jgi:hypothetical protein
MSASISGIVRRGLHSPMRKLAIEMLALGLPILVLLAVHPSLTNPATSPPHGGGGQSSIEDAPMADVTNAKLKQFAERVALSYVVSLQPVVASVATAVVEPSSPAIQRSAPTSSRPVIALRAVKQGARTAHIAAKVTPAPRPTLATVEPAVDVAPEEVKPQLPTQQAMNFATGAWRSVPNSGGFVALNFVSVGNALSSLAKKL